MHIPEEIKNQIQKSVAKRSRSSLELLTILDTVEYKLTRHWEKVLWVMKNKGFLQSY